jgi:hypothetical protein
MEANMSNMKIWDNVSKSDSKFLKKVNVGRGFTAIDAHSQIMKATEVFGPVGEGWGYHVSHSVELLTPNDSVIIASVSVWHGEPSNVFGPVLGCKTLMRNGKTDEDAPKKAMTDGLTKALSHLGFNADVFLGEFDGNKYTDDKPKPKGDW